MSKLAGTFLRMATSNNSGSSSTSVRQVQATTVIVLRTCYSSCGGIQTPHIQASDYVECTWCQNRVYIHGDRTNPAS